MRNVEIFLGIAGTAIILFLLLKSGSDTAQVINSIAGGTSKVFSTLQGRGAA